MPQKKKRKPKKKKHKCMEFKYVYKPKYVFPYLECKECERKIGLP